MNKKVFILRDNGVRDRCKTYLDTLSLGPDEKPMQVTIAPYKKNRTLAQNNLMWMWLTALSNFLRQEHGLDCTPEDLKHEFQNHHALREVRLYYTDPFTKIPKTRVVGTSELTTAQFTEFLNRIEEYANHAGLQLAHPEDLYYEAMGYDKRG